MNDLKKNLFEIAASQQGYFTTQQACAIGYQRNNFPYYRRSGEWIREHRGIYRLALFPQGDDSQLMLWALWSCNQKGEMQGTYSHETALRIYEVSDAKPSKLHLSVPKNFRRHSEIPPVLVLHKQSLAPRAIQKISAYQVTTPLRSVLDLIGEEATEEKIIRQAILNFYQRGFLLDQDISLIKGIKSNYQLKSFLEKLKP